MAVGAASLLAAGCYPSSPLGGWASLNLLPVLPCHSLPCLRWLANGGWWALAHTALVAAGLAVGKLPIRLPGWVCLVCDHFYLGPLALLASR